MKKRMDYDVAEEELTYLTMHIAGIVKKARADSDS